ISGWSLAAGGWARLILEPARVGMPATSNRFFTANGTPASGPSGLRASRALSIACARSSARSLVTAVNELRTGSRSVMRASAASITAAAGTRPAVTAAAISPAEAQAVSIAGSGLVDRCGLGIVRQFPPADQRGKLHCDFEVGAHGWLPLRFERKAKQRGG